MTETAAPESAKQHAVILFTTERQGSHYTVRARCSCGVWRQAASYSAYPGLAGAILLVMQRFGCAGTPLGAFRVARPVPGDLWSVKEAARELDHENTRLRSKAAELQTRVDALLAQAQEYEDRRNQIYRTLGE